MAEGFTPLVFSYRVESTNLLGIFMIFTIFSAIWLLSGFICHGLSFAYYQRNWPGLSDHDYKEDLISCMIMSYAGGPASLISFIIHVLLNSKDFKGFKLY